MNLFFIHLLINKLSAPFQCFRRWLLIPVWGFAFFVALCTDTLLYAQGRGSLPGLSGGSNTTDAEKLLVPDISASNNASALSGSALAVDNVIHAEQYFIGPGDVLLVQIVGPVSVEVPLTVSPENTLLLPRIGEVQLNGKTLAQAKREIQTLVQTRNTNNRAFLTLLRARTVYVKIHGNVITPGLYTLPASMKVSTAVQIANQTPTPAAQRQAAAQPAKRQEQALMEIAPAGQTVIPFFARNTRVLHRNGTSDISDIVRATLWQEPAADPTLREGDEIYVPFEAEATESISIAGAVRRPTVMPFRKGDKISLLLKASFGLTDDADSTRLQLTEAFSAGAAQPATLSAGAVLSGQQDRELTGGSSIFVPKTETVTGNRGVVSVLGQVRKPGMFPIEKGKTRLKSVLSQIGGFLPDAHLPTSVIIRRETGTVTMRNAETDAQRNFQYSTLTAEDTTRYRLDETLRRPTVACDIAAAVEKNSEADNVLLQDGDVIVIATTPNNVFVFGQVTKPGYVEFTAGKNIAWYVQQAGNYANGADTAKMRIIKAKNRLWSEPRTQQGEYITPEAGDQVYVPRVPDLTNDLAFKKMQVELQRESNEIQKANLVLQEQSRVWQIIGMIVGIVVPVFTALIASGRL